MSRKLGEGVAPRDDSVQIELPDGVTYEHLLFLDDLRNTGTVNMAGARPYVAQAFGVDKREASIIVSTWMKTFSARHPR